MRFPRKITRDTETTIISLGQHEGVGNQISCAELLRNGIKSIMMKGDHEDRVSNKKGQENSAALSRSKEAAE